VIPGVPTPDSFVMGDHAGTLQATAKFQAWGCDARSSCA
jgi:hypothetical protein